MAKFSPSLFIEQEIYSIQESQLRSLFTKSDLFSPSEQNYCQNKPKPLLSVAGLWCAKQAFVRGTNLRLEFSDFSYLDLEIRHHASGQPAILLKGNLANWFEKHNVNTKIAISHTDTLAAAIVLFLV